MVKWRYKINEEQMTRLNGKKDEAKHQMFENQEKD